ncbi:MAG: DUF2695 domain-containing protein [Deltaproteobacteria bacterium]
MKKRSNKNRSIRENRYDWDGWRRRVAELETTGMSGSRARVEALSGVGDQMRGRKVRGLDEVVLLADMLRPSADAAPAWWATQLARCCACGCEDMRWYMCALAYVEMVGSTDELDAIGVVKELAVYRGLDHSHLDEAERSEHARFSEEEALAYAVRVDELTFDAGIGFPDATLTARDEVRSKRTIEKATNPLRVLDRGVVALERRTPEPDDTEDRRAKMVLTRDQLTDLYESIDGAVRIAQSIDSAVYTSGCDGSLRGVRAWCRARKIDVKSVCASLEEFGGFCDCEVVMNVDPEEIFHE